MWTHQIQTPPEASHYIKITWRTFLKNDTYNWTHRQSQWGWSVRFNLEWFKMLPNLYYTWQMHVHILFSQHLQNPKYFPHLRGIFIFFILSNWNKLHSFTFLLGDITHVPICFFHLEFISRQKGISTWINENVKSYHNVINRLS
jgi:hypothetical protein